MALAALPLSVSVVVVAESEASVDARVVLLLDAEVLVATARVVVVP